MATGRRSPELRLVQHFFGRWNRLPPLPPPSPSTHSSSWSSVIVAVVVVVVVVHSALATSMTPSLECVCGGVETKGLPVPVVQCLLAGC